MTKYTFEFEESKEKSQSGSGYNGCYSSLKLLVDGKEKMGRLWVETWLQGCGLNGLQRFTGITCWPVECVPALIEFLGKVTSPTPTDGTWTAKRFFFSLTGNQLEYPVIKKFAGHAEELTKVKNLAHGPQDIHLFLLTTQ